MNQIFQKLLTFLIIFYLIWKSLSSLDYMSYFNLHSYKDVNEKYIGSVYYQFFKSQHKEIDNPEVNNYINRFVEKICKANFIENDIKIHILENNEVNAFALPDKHMVIYTGLIKDCDSPEELFGVISHEIAHMVQNHIMKKIIKEIGIATIISLSSGQSGSEILKTVSEKLISSAYDRELETEADKSAVYYLMHSKMNPRPFADFFKKMAKKYEDLPEITYWITSHPESLERYENVLKIIKSEGDYISLNKDEWNSFKQSFNKY
jgi:beta-barrel assembly-enhancing protease